MPVNTAAAAASIHQLRAVMDKQKEQLQQQEKVIIAREQRLHYLRQQQRQQPNSSQYNCQMRENRLKELRASSFGNRLLRRSDSCMSFSYFDLFCCAWFVYFIDLFPALSVLLCVINIHICTLMYLCWKLVNSMLSETNHLVVELSMITFVMWCRG